ncbi:MAG: M23 family metallopeptidase, partial [Anaerolineae bacterium]
MPEPHDSASNTVERNGPSPDGGQIGALVMALAVAGAVALFSSDAPIGVPGYGPGAAIAREPTALAATGSGGSARPGAATGGNVEADMGAAATGSGDTPSRAAVRPLTAAALLAGTETAAATAVTGTVSVTAIDTAAVADVTATPPVTATRASDAAWAQLNSLAPLPPPSSPDLPLGLAADQPPFFSLARPFGTGLEDRASRYYPYGTTGGGEYLLHHGVDIGNPIGTPVLVVADGIVEYAGSDDRASDVMWGPQPDFYGQLEVVRHDNLPRVEGQANSTLYG